MKRLSFVTFLAPLVVASSLHAAAADYLLEIDGIKGESADDRHPNTIEVDSFSWGVNNASTFGTSGGGGAGKVIMQDFHFVAKMSKASPQLMLACASGTHIRKAVLFVRKAGAAEFQEYLTITLEDAFISSVKPTGRVPGSTTGDDMPTEEVAFYYNKVTLVHIADDGTQTIGEAVRTPVVQ